MPFTLMALIVASWSMFSLAPFEKIIVKLVLGAYISLRFKLLEMLSVTFSAVN